MKIFYDYHPKVSLLYFSAVLLISMLTRNPIWVSLSFFFASLAIIQLYRFKFYLKRLIGLLPIFILLLLFNSLFNSRGLTVLFYLGTGKPVTLEVLLYGVFNGLALMSIILWFYVYRNFIKSDEILEIFGQSFPTIGLIFSMTLKYIPDTVQSANTIVLNQKAFLGEEKLKKGDKRHLIIRLFGILLGISMENALQTANSMQAKGYPSEIRKTYLKHTFNGKDRFFVVSLGSFFIFQIITLLRGGSKFLYYPFMTWQSFEQNRILAVCSVCVFFFILLMPYFWRLFDWLKWQQVMKSEKTQAKQVKSGLIIYE